MIKSLQLVINNKRCIFLKSASNTVKLSLLYHIFELNEETIKSNNVLLQASLESPRPISQRNRLVRHQAPR